jgi:hypothetical protein
MKAFRQPMVLRVCGKKIVDYYSRYAYDFEFLCHEYSFFMEKERFFRYFAKKVEKFL